MDELWTIASAAGSGTLAALGADGLTIRYAAADTDVAEIHFPDDDHALANWTHGTAVTLNYSGTARLKGKVAAEPREADDDADGKRVIVKGPWDDLRMPYTESWQHWNGSSTATYDEHARFRLGKSESGDYTDTVAAINEIITYAATNGASIAAGTLPTTRLVPLIQGHGKSCADLLREVLKWHRDCAVWIDYTASPPELNVVESSLLSDITLAATDYPVTAYDITRRIDDEPSGVVIHWEVLSEDTDANATQRFHRRIHTDSAGSTAISPRLISVVLPGILDDPTQPHRREQYLATEAIPENDSTVNATEKWWIRHSPLDRWGIGVGDIVMPSSTAGGIHAHTNTAKPLPDPDDLGEDVEIPSFWSDTLSQLGREILVGQVHDWMRIKYGRVICRATLGLRKTAIDGLDPDLLEEARNLVRPDPRTISGIQAYLLDLEVEVAATNGLTKTYRETSLINGDTVPDVANQTIPGLADAFWDMAQLPRWEGGVTLQQDTAGNTTWMGKALNLTHANRPEWASMNAIVQRVTLNQDGRTQLSIGTPDHLSIQDLAAMRMVMREAQRRKEIGITFSVTDPEDATTPPWGTEGSIKSVGGTAGPFQTRTLIPAQAARRWAPYSNGTATLMRCGKVWAGEVAANATTIGNTSTALDAVAGGGAWLKVGGTTMANLTLESGGTLPEPFLVDESGNLTYYHKILGDFTNTDPGPPGFPIGNGSVYYRPRVADADLLAVSTVFEATGNVANATQGIMLVSW